jgi:hypothetical protein
VVCVSYLMSMAKHDASCRMQAARSILAIARLAGRGAAAQQVADRCLEWCSDGAAFLLRAGPQSQRGLRVAVDALPRQVR